MYNLTSSSKKAAFGLPKIFLIAGALSVAKLPFTTITVIGLQ
jgi:hypothetical protein